MDEGRLDLALRAAESVALRNNNRQAQVRRGFVVADNTSARKITPLAEMIRGGRGGEVRLKLYLSLVWFAANPPYDVTYPARAWAALLALPEPDGLGARRVSDALRWLGDNGANSPAFVELQRRPGTPTRVLLRSELGDGGKYEVPGAAMRRLSSENADPAARLRDRYFQIPPAFWTSGWLAELSGAAVAMLLVLLAEMPQEKAQGVWFSPRIADERFSLSSQTRSKGLNELVHQGLITIRKTSLAARDPFEPQRTRNLYVFTDTESPFVHAPLSHSNTRGHEASFVPSTERGRGHRRERLNLD